jgi:hypothetical protein
MSVRLALLGAAVVLLGLAWPYGVELFIDWYSGMEYENPALARWSAAAHVALFAAPAAVLLWLAAASG